MSVSAEQKKEIITHSYKSSCCRRAMLSGILFAKGRAEGKNVTLSLEKSEYADFAAKLIREFYTKDADIFRFSKGGRSISLSFDSPSAAKFIENIDLLAELPEYSVCNIITQKCKSCLPAFLRGVFLASGRLSDPKKQFSLEFSLGNRTVIFAKILSDLDMSPLISNKKSGTTLYFRRGEEIESFYGHAGLNDLVYSIIETQIKSLARRESQRYLNCVTNNFERMASVSQRQISIISRLEEHQLLSSLPEELEETARLKLRPSRVVTVMTTLPVKG